MDRCLIIQHTGASFSLDLAKGRQAMPRLDSSSVVAVLSERAVPLPSN